MLPDGTSELCEEGEGEISLPHSFDTCCLTLFTKLLLSFFSEILNITDRTVKLESRGTEDYRTTYTRQKELLASVISGKSVSTLISVTHPPVITLGRSAERSDILVSDDALEERNIETIDIERGGKITYHGPGQIVLYPILNLRDFGKDINIYLRSLEKTVIGFLKNLGYDGIPGEEAGVFVQGKKTASIGVAVKRWVTYHGVSINIKQDDNFNLINPCGISSDLVTSLQQLGCDIDLEEAGNLLLSSFENAFEVKLLTKT